MPPIQKIFKLQSDDDLFEIDDRIYICRQDNLYEFNRGDQSLQLIRRDIPKKVHKLHIFGELFMFVDTFETIIMNAKSRISLRTFIDDRITFCKNMILYVDAYDIVLHVIEADLQYREITKTLPIIVDDIYFMNGEIYYHSDNYSNTYVLDINLETRRHFDHERHWSAETLKIIPCGYIYRDVLGDPFVFRYEIRICIHNSRELLFRNNLARFIEINNNICVTVFYLDVEMFGEETYSIPANFGRLAGNEELVTTFQYFDKNNKNWLAYFGRVNLPQDFAACPNEYKQNIIFLAVLLRRMGCDKTIYCAIIEILLADDKFLQ